MRKVLIGAAGLVAVLLVTSMAAFAVDYPVSEGKLVVDKTSVAPGGELALAGDGFAPGASVDISIESTPVHLTTATADGSGAFAATAPSPSTWSPAPTPCSPVEPTRPEARRAQRHRAR